MAEAARIASETLEEERALKEELDALTKQLTTDITLSDDERRRLSVRRAAILEWQRRHEVPVDLKAVPQQHTLDSLQSIPDLSLDDRIAHPISHTTWMADRERRREESLARQKKEDEEWREIRAALQASGHDDNATQPGLSAK